MATGARIVLTRAGWRVKPQFQMNATHNARQQRKAKQVSGKIARARLKEELNKYEID